MQHTFIYLKMSIRTCYYVFFEIIIFPLIHNFQLQITKSLGTFDNLIIRTKFHLFSLKARKISKPKNLGLSQKPI